MGAAEYQGNCDGEHDDDCIRTDLSPWKIAHWTFNENFGPIARDITGNGHDGALKSGVLRNNRPLRTKSNSGKALEFDGVDDYVAVRKDDLFDNLFFTGLSSSVEFWLRANVASGTQQIIGVDGRWDIYLTKEGAIKFTVYDTIMAYTPDGTISCGTWYHIVISAYKYNRNQ